MKYILLIKKNDFSSFLEQIFFGIFNKNTLVIKNNHNNVLKKIKKIDFCFNFQESIISENNLLKIKYPINFHPGTRKVPGRGCYSWAIYKNHKKYGVTAHIMRKKVDTGKIIDEINFDIEKFDTIETLKFKTFLLSTYLFCKVSYYIKFHNKIYFSKKKWQRKSYKLSDLNKINIIKENMPEKIKKKIIRATTYYPFGPYFSKNGEVNKIKLKKHKNIY